MSRLAATPRRSGFALLRTVSSPPVAPHPASQRMQLPSTSGLLAYPDADSHRADTRHRGRTHPREGGDPRVIRLRGDDVYASGFNCPSRVGINSLTVGWM